MNQITEVLDTIVLDDATTTTFTRAVGILVTQLRESGVSDGDIYPVVQQIFQLTERVK